MGRHRYIMQVVKPQPDNSLDVDHLCRRKACCNPEHLEWVTRSENNLRGKISALRPPSTHCRNGHERTPENTYVHNGRRTCSECRRISARKLYKRTCNREGRI